MKVSLGPVLYPDAWETEIWRFRVHLLLEGGPEDPPEVEVVLGPADGNVEGPAPAHSFASFRDGPATWWAWTVELPRGHDDRWIEYQLVAEESETLNGPWNGEPLFDDVCVPGQGALPNLAFFSCNGVSSEKDYHRLDYPQRMWSSLVDRHRELRNGDERGFHLLVGGGDQVYADELWTRKPLSFVRERSHEEVANTDPAELADRAELDPSLEGFRERLLEQYLSLYVEHWTRPHMREAFARIPVVFTWDDHDIMDGWGSRPGTRQESPIYRSVFEAAEEAFQAFQLGGDGLSHCVGEESHYLQKMTFREPEHELTLVVLDVRSGRTRNRVMSDQQWDDLIRVLEEETAHGTIYLTQRQWLLTIRVRQRGEPGRDGTRWPATENRTRSAATSRSLWAECQPPARTRKRRWS